MKLGCDAGTDPGRVRENNEDRFYVNPDCGVFAVADGLGGGAAGEVASTAFVDAVAAAAERFRGLASSGGGGAEPRREPFLEFVDELFQGASRAIYERSEREHGTRGMATTGVFLGVLDGFAVLGHVGDSRAYLLRHGEARQLTTDHTLVQKLVDRGVLAPDRVATFPYKHVLERAIGDLPGCRVDTLWLDLEPGDRFVLCSDGLSRYFDAAKVEAVCKDGAAAAIAAANREGGADNVTVVVVDVIDVTRATLVGTEVRLRALGDLYLFRDLTFQELLQTMKVVRETRYAAGDTVVSEGEQGDRMFVVVEGDLEVRKGRTELARLGRRDHFGEISFMDARPRSATVRALTPAVLLSIQRDEFRSLVQGSPNLATKFLWRFSLTLSERLRNLAEDFVIEKEK